MQPKSMFAVSVPIIVLVTMLVVSLLFIINRVSSNDALRDQIQLVRNDIENLSKKVDSHHVEILTRMQRLDKSIVNAENGIRKDLLILADDVIFPEMNKLDSKLDVLLNIATNTVLLDCRR